MHEKIVLERCATFQHYFARGDAVTSIELNTRHSYRNGLHRLRNARATGAVSVLQEEAGSA